jgi:AcrR family transcriptional regulator
MARLPDPNAKIDLLRAAEQVFVARGLEGAKVEEITAKAGRSKGSFYLHFESKEDAFRQIVETMMARMMALLDEILPLDAQDSRLRDPAAYLEMIVEIDLQTFDFVWQNRGVVRLLLEGGGGLSYGHMIDQFTERSRKRTERFIENAVRHGIFRRDLDARLASHVLSAAYERVARELVRRERKPDLKEWIRTIQHLMLRGMGSERVVTLIDRQVTNSKRRRLG